MSILNRPLFRRKLSKNELKMHGIQAFANGGVVAPYDYLMQRRMADGGPTDPKDLLPQVPPMENMADPVNLQTGESMLVNNFINLMKESGLIEELKEAQRTGNKQLENTLYEVYRNAYTKQVTEPMEEGMASENMMGYAEGGEVEEEEETVFDVGDASIFESEEFKTIPTNKREREQRIKALQTGVSDVVIDSSGRAQKVNPNRTDSKVLNELNKRYAEGKISEEQYNNLKKQFDDAKKQERAVGIEENENTKVFNENIDIQASDLDKQIAQAEEEGNTGLVDALKKQKEKILKEKKDLVSEKVSETTTITDTESGGGLEDPSKEREKLMSLEEMVKERSELYKSMLGDPKKQLAMQGYMQLAQFGLNLASAQGSNFAAKVANSAKDPLAAFAALGRQAQQDENAITLAAIKSSEDERAQSLKPGNFRILVNDLMSSNPELTLEAAADQALQISMAKSGLTEEEMKEDYFKTLVKSYTERDALPTDEAVAKAEAEVARRFGTVEETSTKTTAGGIIEISTDADFEALAPGTQFRNKGDSTIRRKE